jgi:hypothetical protein
VKDAGSLGSFRGYNLTTASGVGAVFVSAGLAGGEIGRVAERGSALLGFACVEIFSGTLWPLLVPLFTDCGTFFGAIDPTKMGFVAGGLGSRVACKAGPFGLSLSFGRLVSRALSSGTKSVAFDKLTA